MQNIALIAKIEIPIWLTDSESNEETQIRKLDRKYSAVCMLLLLACLLFLIFRINSNLFRTDLLSFEK